MSGWIKTHRKLLEHPRFKDSEFIHVWLWMLLTATHKPYDVIFQGKRITLKPGQFTAGRLQISQQTGVNESKVKRVVALLKSDQQIDQQTSNACSLFTILNWDKYQVDDQPNGQQMTSHRPASDQPVTTKQEQKNIRIKEESSGEPQEGLPLGDLPAVAEKKTRKQDPLFNALAEACGIDITRLTPQGGSQIGVAISGIRKATPNVTEEMIQEACANYRIIYKDAVLTPTAICKHWATLGDCSIQRNSTRYYVPNNG